MILKGLIFVFSYEQKYALIFCYMVFTFTIACVYPIRCLRDMASKKMMKKQRITSYEEYVVFFYLSLYSYS